jgi:hypothetical protein
MRTTWNLKPAAIAMVRSLARQRNLHEGEAASLLILNGGAGHKPRKYVLRQGVPVVRAPRAISAEEVKAALEDE